MPAEVTELVEKRAAAKKAKDWAAADAIRAQLTEMGWACLLYTSISRTIVIQ